MKKQVFMKINNPTYDINKKGALLGTPLRSGRDSVRFVYTATTQRHTTTKIIFGKHLGNIRSFSY